MQIRSILSIVATLLLVATQISCSALPGSQRTPTPAPLTPPHTLLQVEEDDLTVTLTLIDGDDGRKDVAWTVESTSRGPGYEVAIHQATLRSDSRVRSWAEAEKASSSRTTSSVKSPGREPGKQGTGRAMLHEVRPGERVTLFLELKVELADENGASAEFGTIRGPVILEPAGAGWALVSPS